MTPEAQRIAIAEACGWSACPNMVKFGMFFPSRKGVPIYGRDYLHANEAILAACPDYLNDLNAMHEAEMVLRPEGAYGEWPLWDKYVEILGEQHTGCDDVAHATARQKAVAFLKTIGKWEGCR